MLVEPTYCKVHKLQVIKKITNGITIKVRIDRIRFTRDSASKSFGFPEVIVAQITVTGFAFEAAVL